LFPFPPSFVHCFERYDASAIDVWACGCVLAELFNRAIFFNGASDIDQLSRIFAVVGVPSEKVWPGVRLLPDFLDFDAGGETPMSEV
jgi:serine/threonine protein kinase